MKEPKDITCLVVDKGLFSDVPVRLAQVYKRVLYYVPNLATFPICDPSFIGTGLEDIEVVDSIFGEHFGSIDLFFFPFTGFGPEQQFLRDQGKIVFGSGLGEIMELDRPLMKEMLHDENLPVGKHKVITGTDNLRSYLKDHKNVYVKMSPKYRGMGETFHAPDLRTVEPKLDWMEFKQGPLKHEVEYDVEDELPDKREIGYDGYVCDGMLPSRSLCGPEIKDAGFAGRIIDFKKLSDPIQKVTKSMAELSEQYGYRGCFSNEIRIGEDQKPYMIDATMRMASPPGLLYSEMFQNFPEIAWHIANGEMLDPEIVKDADGKEMIYGVQLQMKSSWSVEGNWTPIDFDPKCRRNVKITAGLKRKDRYYHVPVQVGSGGLEEPGAILGWGHSYKEAIAMVEKISKEVSGCDLSLNIEALQKAEEEISKSKEIGIDLT